MPLYLMLAAVFLYSAVLMTVMSVAANSFVGRSMRIHEGRDQKPQGGKLWGNIFKNMLFSGALVYVLAYGLYPLLFDGRDDTIVGMLWDSLKILVLYDFLYYLLHRYAFHEWKLLRKVHTVHHTVRHPTAADSLYLHPVETFLGVALLAACTWMLGPVDTATFAVVFFVYTTLNIMVHCGLDIPVPGFRGMCFMARKHATHHHSMGRGNFASLTPFFDQLFGTDE